MLERLQTNLKNKKRVDTGRNSKIWIKLFSSTSTQMTSSCFLFLMLSVPTPPLVTTAMFYGRFITFCDFLTIKSIKNHVNQHGISTNQLNNSHIL